MKYCMSKILAVQSKKKGSFATWTILGVLIAASVVVIAVRLPMASASGPALNNVQLFINPQNSSIDSYLVSVYNSTGGFVASTQTQYPGASFELPSGEYIFTANANSPYSYLPGPITASQGGASGSLIPYKGYNNPSEYGYEETSISGPQTLSINTIPIENVSSTSITVTATYKNGTAASGASIEASIIGGDNFYYSSENLVMYNTTGNDGVATLVVPSVPVEVNAWSWVPVNLPQNQTTTVVTIGGEPVNVTVYWQPTYVGLAGSALMLPPQNALSITMTAQQPSYWAVPYASNTVQGVATPSVISAGTGASSGSVSNGPGAIPASLEQSPSNNGQGTSTPQQAQTQTVPAQITMTVTKTASPMTSPASSSSSSSETIVLEAGVVAAIIIAFAGIVLGIRRK